MLIAKGRLRSLDDPGEIRLQVMRAGIREMPLTGQIAILAVQLDLHGDPADRFIAATAVAHDATLMTADETLLGWRSKVRRINAERRRHERAKMRSAARWRRSASVAKP